MSQDGIIVQARHEIFLRTIQTHIRRKRFRFIRRIIAAMPETGYLLDVGGTPEFWEKMQCVDKDMTIILLNLREYESEHMSIISLLGDGCDMAEFDRGQFSLVFSNSVIEHVGDFRQQQRMASEIRRVARWYCVQTPNRYFPLEPHVLIPCFQFFPFALQVWLLTHLPSPWGWRLGSRAEAEEYVRGIRLLSERELRQLFPGASIYREKFLGLTKSFIVYKCS